MSKSFIENLKDKLIEHKVWTESEIEEAERRQVSLKADFKAATGNESEWSDVGEEGPILLTTNKVRGKEVLPVLKERLK